MKLYEYIKYLQKIEKKHPDLKVIYSADEEGNCFNPVHYLPVTGNFRNGVFKSEKHTANTINAVCIN